MTQNNLKIAITGGIGSGKSTISEIIKEQGYKVVSCDEIYNQLLSNKDFLNKLSCEFGDILDTTGMLNRKKLSAIVFADEDKLKKLNEITHPAIMEEAFRQMPKDEVCFCEVPLLFEGGFEDCFDKVIIILRDKELRINAVENRDKIDKSQVKSRINSQYDYENESFEMYYVIHNDSDLVNLRAKTIEVVASIIEK